MGPLPSAKKKWHIHNALDAMITADLVHYVERGFQMHILWLYNSSISQSYRGFTGFGGICSGIPRSNTASKGLQFFLVFGSGTERPQSARDAPCHIPMATQTGSALWLALVGGRHRVTAVISKAKVVGGQSSVVLSKHRRGARKAA